MEFGAIIVFDYNDEDSVKLLSCGLHVPYIIDCIGSLEGTLTPLGKIAGNGSKVGIMLPVLMSHASTGNVLVAQWNEGVDLRGVKTHFYQDDDYFKYHLQLDIVPVLVEEGLLGPNKQRLMEGRLGG
ncbi:alcohol dehydrogenase [Diaporthe helianthi]|uniref:Alcohol dehydrogenase n=1 Tax=Diaporthe helianthi TaxID=158607 RepID=A0A2P5I3L2_DIAHE|nr:alcohol dehydrogenase [Diaporthe helianthi]